jgi:hypothetical protein
MREYCRVALNLNKKLNVNFNAIFPTFIYNLDSHWLERETERKIVTIELEI